MVPSIFGENLFDEFWNDPFDMDRMLPRGRDPLYGKHSKNLMTVSYTHLTLPTN